MTYSTKEVGVKSPHGIYRYSIDEDEWVLVEAGNKAFIPRDNYAVVYFDNTQCPACRRYDVYWYPFVRRHAAIKKNYGFYIVLCGWFSGECDSPPASLTFLEFDVHASPTTYFLHCSDLRILYKEKYEGVMSDVDLEKIIDGFEERAKKFLSGEEVHPPLREEESLLNLIRQILRGGKTDDRR